MATTETIQNSDGGNIYSFSFAYLKTEDVKVELQEYDSTQSLGNEIISRQTTTAFVVPSNNPTQIELSAISSDTVYQTADGNVRTTSTNGYVVRVRIYRFTDAASTPATFSPGTSVRAVDLNDNFEQILFIMQERQNTLQQISGGSLGENVITTAAIQDNAVTADKLASDSLTDSARAVTTNHIRDGAVTTSKIADGAVTTAKIAADAVDGTKIADDSIDSEHYVDGSIDTAHIANDAVTTAKIADASVTTAKIADDSVTEAKISGNKGFVPTGAIFWFVSSSKPNGYLKCNGATIPNGVGTVQNITRDFSALYALTGGTLPDLRGEFIRGFDDGRGVDSGRSINTAQSDQNKQHNHTATATSTVNDPGHKHDFRGFKLEDGSNRTTKAIQDDDRQSARQAAADADASAVQNKTTGITVSTSVTVNNNGGSEARPRNIALLACIKY